MLRGVTEFPATKIIETIRTDKHDADSISLPEGGCVVEHCRDDDRSDHQQPIRQRYVELIVEDLRSVNDRDLRKIAQFDDLG